MDENVLKFRVGAFVLMAMLILGILIFVNSEGWWIPKYTVYIKPVSAPGVTVGTPVRKNGILIGRVQTVETANDHVTLGLAINEKEQIYTNEVCSIGAESFLGDAVIEVLPLALEKRGDPVPNEHVMSQVAVKRNPMEIIDVALNLEAQIAQTLTSVQQAVKSVEEAGVGIQQLTSTVQTAFDDEDSEVKKLLVEFRLMSEKARIAIERFDRIFENVNEIVGDDQTKAQIRQTLATLPEIFDEVRSTVADTRETINSFRDVTGKASQNLDNLQAFTGSLRENGPEILLQVRDSLKKVDDLMAGIDGFTKSFRNLQNSQGTIGKLLNDSELYDNVLETVENVRDLSVRLEPMVNDLRMFADAIARDPGVLGVRGATLNRRPEKTGYKGIQDSPLLRRE